MLRQKKKEYSVVINDKDVVFSRLDSFSDEDIFSIEFITTYGTKSCAANLITRKGAECLYFSLISNIDSFITRLNEGYPLEVEEYPLKIEGYPLKIKSTQYCEMDPIIVFRSAVQIFLDRPARLLIVKFPNELIEIKTRERVRYETNLDSMIFFADEDNPIRSVISDISYGGCRAHFRTPTLDFNLKKNVVLQIRIKRDFEIVLLEGRVTSKEVLKEETFLGIEFVSRSDELTDYIHCLERAVSLDVSNNKNKNEDKNEK